MDLFNSLDQQMQEGRKEKRKRNHLLSYNLLALDQSVAIQEMKCSNAASIFHGKIFSRNTRFLGLGY
jgi:hypothetical protein